MHFIKTTICLFILIGCCVLHTTGQTTGGTGSVVIKGKITDKKTKEPINGVSVTEIDTDGRIVKGTATDIEGNYILKITNPKNRISITYIGYKSITQSLNNRTTINLQLEDGSLDMSEVIVVASRTTDNGMLNISERNSTIAASKISAKEL